MSFVERYRELATLKVVGFKNKTISKIEDTDYAFKQMDDNKALLAVYLLYIASIATFLRPKLEKVA